MRSHCSIREPICRWWPTVHSPDVIRTGWYCPDCHRVFKTAFRTTVGRFHNRICGTAMIACRVMRRA